mmetsp:Transcript_101906/g.263365  ORF Transcript_101906/g.263365 Transcript_101906/m.263365 type:complete len:218 (-) Transcript_101906:29-682(-)
MGLDGHDIVGPLQGGRPAGGDDGKVEFVRGQDMPALLRSQHGLEGGLVRLGWEVELHCAQDAAEAVQGCERATQVSLDGWPVVKNLAARAHPHHIGAARPRILHALPPVVRQPEGPLTVHEHIRRPALDREATGERRPSALLGWRRPHADLAPAAGSHQLVRRALRKATWRQLPWGAHGLAIALLGPHRGSSSETIAFDAPSVGSSETHGCSWQAAR